MTGGLPQDWLNEYVANSVARKLCTRYGCTTCGAMEFRDGFIRLLSKAEDQDYSRPLTSDGAKALATALAFVQPGGLASWEQEEAVRLILMEIWAAPCRDSGREQVLESILGDTWPGELLARMKKHDRQRSKELQLEAERNDPELAKLRREEKKRLRQIKHTERLAAKKERDRIWWRCHIN